MRNLRDAQNLESSPFLSRHIMATTNAYDVFIVGSGLIGATYARMLVEKGFNVGMADVGEE